jgi:hypothetical protein
MRRFAFVKANLSLRESDKGGDVARFSLIPSGAVEFCRNSWESYVEKAEPEEIGKVLGVSKQQIWNEFSKTKDRRHRTKNSLLAS